MRRIARVRALTLAMVLTLCGALGFAAPAMAANGSISGVVTEAGGGAGIAGIWVCANTHRFGPIGGCEQTQADGSYEIGNLEPGLFEVVFEEEGRQNYLAQWYPGKATAEEAEWVEVESGQDVTGIDADLGVGGQITGTVTDVEGGAPIEGVEICAPQVDRVTEVGVIHCDISDSEGEYTVQALPTGQYKIEFGPPRGFPESPNFIPQYYPGKPSWSEAEVRNVTAGATVAGIDAAMQEGIRISGTVTEAGGAGLTWEARVCALNAITEAVVQCDFPGKDGTYWIPGLPFGNYKVSFAVDVEEEPGLILHPDGFVRQYYNGKPTFEAADVLGSGGPAAFSGIDAQLVKGPEVFPKRPPAPQPVVVTLIERPGPKPLHCRRGFRKRWVRGARRCVKIHKHRPRSHGHGPHAAATAR
jgi:hypothetical protein